MYFVHYSSIISPSSLVIKCEYFLLFLFILNYLKALSLSCLSSYLCIYFIIYVSFTDPDTPKLHIFLRKLYALSYPYLLLSILYSFKLF
nr:MAG TPA: hypothetical protein [Caudoviricetes sp.]